MRKFALLTAFFAIMLPVMALPLVVSAQDPIVDVCVKAPDSPVCRASSENPLYGPSGIVTRVTQFVIYIVGVASVVMIMIGGFRYITSSGDPSGIEGAKNTILFAVIGLVVALVGQILVAFVLRRLN